MNKNRTTIASLLIAMLILSLAFVPLVSAKENSNTGSSKVDKLTSDEKKLIDEYNFTLEEIQYYKDLGFDAKTILKTESKVKVSKSLPMVIKEAPYWPMVTADSELQTAILEHINSFSVSNAEKEEMKTTMKDIWSRAPDRITEDDYPGLRKIGNALDTYLGETYWNEKSTDVSIKWSGNNSTINVHGDFIYYGVMKAYNNQNWANTAKGTANDPDNGVIDSDWLRYYNHYYNPSLLLGGAPNRCTNFALIAKNNYASNKNVAFSNLGLASHYLSDVGNPMHTDGEWDQFLDSAPHIAYEAYVANNWVYGYNYQSIVSSNNAVKTVTYPAVATSDLASFSNAYYQTLWDEIIANPTGFGADIDVRYSTTKVIRETAKYNWGLAAYIST